ncbi:MAG: 16S rRNA (cytidine(1402)-2'-O)-methyltransferase [Oscillospiraceae bacterium]|jgi:16S rRNA (cytidine1402-2'-O)-methyltransferase|nr:16S rRNA (cytidine(1402)-2'-O)-methyltransferase [Oscillospiraceae bacterium]
MSTLYVVGTPLGNLGDLSPRALETLQTADFIAAEDTRVTLRLLNRFGIKKPLCSYHEHNRRESGTAILERLQSGESCALVTDAGMPAISDPGEDLVRLCRERGIAVVAVPGASALTTALAVSGMPSGRFTFEGFLSTNTKNRRKHLAELITEKRTVIFYEAPHKLPHTLRDLSEALGDRKIALARELTKLYEEVTVTTLSQAAEKYSNETPRGEFVIIIEGANEPKEEPVSLPQAAELAREYVKSGLSKTQAAKKAAFESGIKKSEIYKLIADI